MSGSATSRGERRPALLSTTGPAGEGIWLARLRATAPRHVAVAALLVLLALGLRSLLWPPQPESTPLPVRADAPSRSFALQFARAYLTYDANRPGRRARSLAGLVPNNLDRGAGVFAESGSQRVLWAEIASDQPALVGGRVITVAAGVSTQPAPFYLAVTVRHPPGGAVSLAGYPSLVGPPAVDTSGGGRTFDTVSDPDVSEVVTRVLRNYLAGSTANLKADLTEDAQVALPTVPLRLEGVDRLAWLGGEGSSAVLATVMASDPRGVSYTLTYEAGLSSAAGRPYVSYIEVIPTGS